jgi:hypothetical protein
MRKVRQETKLKEMPQQIKFIITKPELAVKQVDKLVRLPGFEPESTAWEAAVLPN